MGGSIGNVTIGVTMDKKAFAQDLRATAALLDPEGAVVAKANVDLQKEIATLQDDLTKVRTRRDSWKELAEQRSSELRCMTEQRDYFQHRFEVKRAEKESLRQKLLADLRDSATTNSKLLAEKQVADAEVANLRAHVSQKDLNLITELRWKLDLEVRAHRGNVVLLHKAWAARDVAETKAYNLAKAFMDLHNQAKDIVGPPTVAAKTPPLPKTVQDARDAAVAQLSQADRDLLGF